MAREELAGWGEGHYASKQSCICSMISVNHVLQYKLVQGNIVFSLTVQLGHTPKVICQRMGY